MREAYDVIVAGGGPAGMGAAVAAARNGVSTLLVEKTNCLGGMLTNGLVPILRTAGDGGGIVAEFRERLERASCARVTPSHVWADPAGARVVLLDMLEESGADLLLHAHTAGAALENGGVAGVRVAAKAGPALFCCRVAIDATGDGDLAFAAGAPFEKGREGDGALQAVSLNFVLAGVDDAALPDPAEFRAACAAAVAAGRIELAPGRTTLDPGWSGFGRPPGVRAFQFDLADGVDGSDAESLTRGERLCHRRVFAIWRFLRETFPAFRESVIVDIASHLGVRESRRIAGEATLTDGMVTGGVKQPDGVSRCSWYIDLHDEPERKTPERRAALRPPPGDWYEIPYGCLVPKRPENLLVAGRCVSSTRGANGSLRLQPTCMNLGQAAGTAAALCVARGLTPRRLDGRELRAVLAAQGMEL